MRDIRDLLEESGLTAEQLGARLGVSGMTVRRWSERPAGRRLERFYERAMYDAIFQMVADGLLDGNSPSVRKAMRQARPLAQEASSKMLLGDGPAPEAKGGFESAALDYLARIGQKEGRLAQVTKQKVKLQKLAQMGAFWRKRISALRKIATAQDSPLLDRSVAIGALFYLLQVFDLIPDLIPVFGYLDDFGLIMIASMYFARRTGKKGLS